ncbi:MAG: dihydroorotate dehydrogenase electron transfer subunit [Syntrophomonadaceae bacterium]|nr:dihydroorotate dehydrogenase electron transfer subunit [Syntrophomonadaceae bacterium]
MARLEKGIILSHRQVAPEIYSLEFAAPALAREASPGQFLQVRTSPTYDPLLRRPISLFDAEAERGVVTLLYRVVGRGTSLLTELPVDGLVDVMGPLGRGFTLPERPEKVLLVGGGMGLAPLLFLGRMLKQGGSQVKILGGAADAQRLWAGNRFERLGISFSPVTVDGSAGRQGLVAELLADWPELDQVDRIYCCGPEAMMAAVSKIAREHNIWGELSLEEHMACGVGACLGCARLLQPGDTGYVKICKDGPVFNMSEVQLFKLD